MHFDVNCNVRLKKDIEIRPGRVAGKDDYGLLTVVYERGKKGSIPKVCSMNVFCPVETAEYLIARGYGQGDTVNIRGEFIAVNLKDENGKPIGMSGYINVPPKIKAYGIDGGAYKREKINAVLDNMGKQPLSITQHGSNNNAMRQNQSQSPSYVPDAQPSDKTHSQYQQQEQQVRMQPMNGASPNLAPRSFTELRAEMNASDNFDDEDIIID